MKRINVITIDGPAASGKGSLAIGIANQFSLKFLIAALFIDYLHSLKEIQITQRLLKLLRIELSLN